MKKVTYTCNLCGEPKERTDLMCLYWKSGMINQKYSLSKDAELSDKHICKRCIEIIKNYEK